MFSIVACVCEHDGKILSLLRRADKSQGDLWALPAGKIEATESATYAMQRELLEETRLRVDIEQLQLVKDFTFNQKTKDVYRVHLYYLQLDQKPVITIDNNEHQLYQWFRKAELLALPNVIADMDALLAVCTD